jgi:predicted extracellular nuclease
MTVASVTPTPVPSAAAVTPIPEIQGAGLRSSYTDLVRTTEGVVTGSKITTFAHDRKVQTIYIQDPKGDGDARTSDGMAVRVSPPIADVKVGQHLIATGTVSEKYKMTALENAKVQLGELGEPIKPKIIDLPHDVALSDALLESLEGTYVSFPKAVVMGGIDSNGAFTVNDAAKHGAHKDYDKEHAGTHFVVATDPENRPNVATTDTVEGIEGALEQTGEGYQTHLAAALKVTKGVPVPKLWGDLDGNGAVDASDVTAIGARAGSDATSQLDPADMNGDGTITAADTKLAKERAERMSSTAPSFNVVNVNAENYFDTVDRTEKPGNRDTVLTPAEFAAKTKRLGDLIAGELNAPTLVAMEEIENTDVLDALVKSPALEKYGYKYELLEGTDGRGIDSALLYRSDQGVTVANTHQINARGRQNKWGDFDPKGEKEVDVFKRPPLVVDVHVPGVDGSGDADLTVMVNHFTSAYSPNGFSTEPWRIEQAKVLKKHVAELRKQNPERDVLVVGDLNANESSLAMQELGSGSSKLRNLSKEFVPRGERYSYVYRGSSEELDHMFATKEFMDRVSYARVHHLNADYPSTTERATDHDLLEARINFPAASPAQQ